MWIIENTCAEWGGQSATRWGLRIALCLAASCVAHGQTAELPSVQPATIKDRAVALYGIVREIPDYPFGKGTVLAVQVTASDADATTALRQQAGSEPCPDCTTTHYFLVREPGEKRPEILVRAAPGPVTYIHISDREYMLGSIDLAWGDDGKPQLDRATLLQTGFVPPIFKRRVKLRFDAPLESGSRTDEVVAMAMADMMEGYGRAQQAYEAAVERKSGANSTP